MRRLSALIDDDRFRDTVEFVERHADGEVDQDAVRREHAAATHRRGWAAAVGNWVARVAIRVVDPIFRLHPEVRKTMAAVREAGERAQRQTQEGQVLLLRCIFGNPFRPGPSMAPDWLTWNGGAVRRLAEDAYDLRHLPEGTLDVYRLALVADALEDASCTDAELLNHLRGPGPHVRGCWALDRVLGRK
jgi:hypothetical protein